MAADIFKILSRSTKLSKGKTATSLQTRPSDGGRPEGQKHAEDAVTLDARLSGRKSPIIGKRQMRHEVPETAGNLIADIDFFGVGTVQPHVIDRANKPIDSREVAYSGAAESPAAADAQVRPWTEEECKHELRKHKVKVTVLENWKLPPKESRKRKRTSSQEDTPTKKKQQKAQLYPQPLCSLHELSPRYAISQRLLDNIEAQGYTLPTEVQLAAIPLLLDWQTEAPPDLLSVAPTGSGKTLAFLIPTMDSIMRIRKRSINSSGGAEPAEDGPLAIILAPTKELASQIVNEGRRLALQTGIKVTLMKKGMGVVDRAESQPTLIEASADGDSLLGEHIDLEAEQIPDEAPQQRVKTHVLVSTPLVLLHAITRSDKTITPLPTVRHLVLDEADVLLDPLFREQVLSIWNACNHLDMQVSMWSATMGSNIEALARDTIAARHSALTLTDGPTIRTPLLRLVIGLKDTALPSICHKLIYAATEAGKLMAVRQLLRPTAPSSRAQNASPLDNNDLSSLQPPFLIFTQTIPRANALAAELKYDIPPSAGGPSRIAALHAHMSDHARDATMAGFRKGEIWVLITTDLLARGVDFRGVNGVVNYDVPTSAASYVHRAGRTGRAGRQGGIAVTLYADEDVPFLKPIANVIAMSESSSTEATSETQRWLLNSLPTPTQREKKLLKQRGLEARRPGKEKARISTKSGFERRMERRKRDARESTESRQRLRTDNGKVRVSEQDNEFQGFGD